MTDTTTTESAAVTAEPAADPPEVGQDIARYDSGSLIVPTSIPGLVLTFTRGQEALTDEQMHLLEPIGIKASWSPGAVAVFLLQCHQRGLNPWAKQAYLLEIDNKLVYHIGIEGLRRKSEESGLYAGVVGPQWCGPDGVWRDVWLDGTTPPAGARVGILRKDFDGPVWGVATYEEFAPIVEDTRWIDDPSGRVKEDGRPVRQKVKTGIRRPAANWRSARDGGKPGVMLAKVAEAAGRRLAFPDRCGGFYVAEETEKARTEATAVEGEVVAPVVSETTRRRREAYAAAMEQVTQAGPVPVFAGLAMADEQARELLIAELDEQAAIGETTRDAITRRFCQARGGIALADAPLRDLARLVHDARPFVVKKLRELDRPDEANLYANAPAVGTCEELFGRRPAVMEGASS